MKVRHGGDNASTGMRTPASHGSGGHPDVSVIIVTRNRPLELPICVERLLRDCGSSGISSEIIIVDTSTAPTPLPQIKDAGRSVQHHYLGDAPFSMVRSRNFGLCRARADIVAFLDDDSYVLPGWTANILAPYQDPGVVAVGGRIIYHPWQTPSSQQTVAVLDLNQDHITARWDTIGDTPVAVPHLPGCNFSVRRSAALAVGGFDTNFIGSANLEETDFLLRVGGTGGLILFVPDAAIEHRAAPRSDGITRAQTNYQYRYSAVRNRLYLLRKHRAHRGFRASVRRQLIDTAVGSARLGLETLTFTAASIAGVVGGVLCSAESESAGLDVSDDVTPW